MIRRARHWICYTDSSGEDHAVEMFSHLNVIHAEKHAEYALGPFAAPDEATALYLYQINKEAHQKRTVL